MWVSLANTHPAFTWKMLAIINIHTLYIHFKQMFWFIKQREMQWSNSQIEWKSTALHIILRELVRSLCWGVEKRGERTCTRPPGPQFNLAYHNVGGFFGNIIWGLKFVMQVVRKLILNVPYILALWIERWHAFWWCCFRQTFAFRSGEYLWCTKSHVHDSEGQGALLWANYMRNIQIYIQRHGEKEALFEVHRYVQRHTDVSRYVA